MKVRPLRDPADVRELSVAHARAWRAASATLLPDAVIDRIADERPDDERIAGEFDRLSGYGPDRVLVAEDDAGTIRGYVVFRWGENETRASIEAGEAELKELYVDPDHWGNGYGTGLLEAGIARLPSEVDSIALETLAGNDPAAEFYESRGFAHDGAAAFDVGGERYPTLVYRKPLD